MVAASCLFMGYERIAAFINGFGVDFLEARRNWSLSKCRNCTRYFLPHKLIHEQHPD